MPLFRCDKCGCVENTALCMYWAAKSSGNPKLCSECETGTWHGSFPKRSAEGMQIDSSGTLWPPGVTPPPAFKIVGIVPPNNQVERTNPRSG